MGLRLKLTEAELLSFSVVFDDDGLSGVVETTRRFGEANCDKRMFIVAYPHVRALQDARLGVISAEHTALGTTRFEVRSLP